MKAPKLYILGTFQSQNWQFSQFFGIWFSFYLVAFSEYLNFTAMTAQSSEKKKGKIFIWVSIVLWINNFDREIHESSASLVSMGSRVLKAIMIGCHDTDWNVAWRWLIIFEGSTPFIDNITLQYVGILQNIDYLYSVSSVMEFLLWLVLKSKFFFAKNQQTL